MNKKELIKKFSQSDEDTLLLSKILDKEGQCTGQNRVTHTKFLDIREVTLCKKFLTSAKIHNAVAVGGFSENSRQIIMFLPDYVDADSALDYAPTKVIRIHNKTRNELSHRDFLGSIMGLNIERSQIGDISVHENGADVMILEESFDFLELNLTKIGKTPVSVSEIDMKDVILAEEKFKEITATIASSRLDSIVAIGFSMSRSECVKLIERGLCMKNYEVAQKISEEVFEGDVISMRGYGKFKLASFSGTSRSGRIFVNIQKYI